jgi:hypothetical protein
MFDALLSQLEKDLRTALGACVTELVATARTRLEGAVADVAKERADGLVEVAKERAQGLAEVDARCADLGREIEAMHRHKEAQEGHVELNIGGYRFQTSVQTLRRVPHTFFDAYFSGRYAQDVCLDGSIFVDRDGEHFRHVLEYMRDGVVSVAEAGTQPSVSLLRALKREFGFYCIELSVEHGVEQEQPEFALVMGGLRAGRDGLSSMERYDVASGRWSAAAAMSIARFAFGACVIAGELYITGGDMVIGQGYRRVPNTEKYSPSSDTWRAVSPLFGGRSDHCAVAVGLCMYVVGGKIEINSDITASVLKYDSTQDTWSEVAPMPTARYGFAACVVGRDIYVFGDASTANLVPVFKFDTEVEEWDILPPIPVACKFLSASVLDGLVYITGAGISGREVLSFDPASHVWNKLASTSSNRRGGAAFVLNGLLYFAGGYYTADGSTISTSSVERYDVASNTWVVMPRMLEGRRYFGAVAIGSAGPTEEQDLFDSLIVKASRRHS